jgi:polyhydroxyalkanoate synthesis regulator phasin
VDATFLTERITATKNQIATLEDAALSLSTGAITSYTLDTGQSRQVVTKTNVSLINKTIDSLYNRLATLEARLNGSGTVIGRPAW